MKVSMKKLKLGNLDGVRGFFMRRCPPTQMSLPSAVAIFILLSINPAYAITEKEAVPCIIGEASSQGYIGMLAVAGAIRNRATLKGVYGCTAPHINREPQYVWNLASRAWRESSSTDLTYGANSWESIHFPEPYWAKSMVFTIQIGDHKFYKGGLK